MQATRLKMPLVFPYAMLMVIATGNHPIMHIKYGRSNAPYAVE